VIFRKTPQLKDKFGCIIKGSFASLEKIRIGKLDQGVLIRGTSQENPVILFLHGGPGTAQISIARTYQSLLENHFIVVNWDQRGAGISYSNKIPVETMHLEQFISDTRDLVRHLIQRFNQEKIYIVGHSWGSILGLLTVHRHPELFHSYIGVGQVVNMDQNEKIAYQFVLNSANENDNKSAIKELQNIGFPPYGKNLKSSFILRKWLLKFGAILYKNGQKSSLKMLLKIIFFSNEYNLFDSYKYLRGRLFSARMMWHNLADINLFEQVNEVKVPVYFFIGRHDYNTPFELAESYFEYIKAPFKKLIWFEKSAHSPYIEEMEKFSEEVIKMKIQIEKKSNSV
jgi:pimeloyl-ACP methyl ester carboxylesterase